MWFIEGVVSSLVGVALLVLGGVALSWYGGRQRFGRFFHLVPAGICVYASRLDVLPGGSTGVDGQRRNYAGAAMPDNELEIVSLIESFFARLAPATNQLSGRLSRLRIQWSDVTVNVRLSPNRVDLLEEEATIFATGSPAYNLASSVIESEFTGIGGFTADFSSIFVPGQELFPSPTHAIVQRRIHPKTGQCAFYAAGFSTLGTSAAGRYLFTHWKSLFKTYGSSEPFTVVLEVRGESPGRPAVVFESSTN